MRQHQDKDAYDHDHDQVQRARPSLGPRHVLRFRSLSDSHDRHHDQRVNRNIARADGGTQNKLAQHAISPARTGWRITAGPSLRAENEASWNAQAQPIVLSHSFASGCARLRAGLAVMAFPLRQASLMPSIPTPSY